MNLTEQEIRSLAIGFLKNHYKFRPHKVWNGIKVRNERHDIDGIVIDASLTYVQQDGHQFLATVEASSVDRANEVYFRFHWFRLLFESLTLSLFVTAIVYGLFAEPWADFLASYMQAGGWQSAFQLFGGSIALFSILLLTNPKRYRYIYAIEQFKLFHADDQWIAYDADLFHTHEDRNYRELERQCMYFGFGLMQVERERRIRVILSPKRGDYFGQKRKKLPVWAATLSQAPILGEVVKQRLEDVVEVDETIQLKDPLAEMNFDLPLSEEENVTELAKSVTTKSGFLERFKGAFKQRKTDASNTSNTTAKSAPPQTLDKRFRRFYLDNRPAFMKALPGFFNPPARWHSVFLFAIVANLLVLTWRISENEIVPLITKEEKLDLEQTFERRAPGGPELEAELNGIDPIETTTVELDNIEATTEKSIVLDEARLEQLAPKAASDVMHYALGTRGDTLVSDQCIAFSRSGQRLYGMVFGRYNNLDAALDDAFRLHTDLQQDILVSKGDCLQQPTTSYLVMIGKPSADEGEINLRYRKLRRDAKLDVEVLAFD